MNASGRFPPYEFFTRPLPATNPAPPIVIATSAHARLSPTAEDPMTTRRQGSNNRGKTVRDKAEARTPSSQRHATTPDATRQQQALDNQGAQGRMAPSWRNRISDDEDDDDETPPTLH